MQQQQRQSNNLISCYEHYNHKNNETKHWLTVVACLQSGQTIELVFVASFVSLFKMLFRQFSQKTCKQDSTRGDSKCCLDGKKSEKKNKFRHQRTLRLFVNWTHLHSLQSWSWSSENDPLLSSSEQSVGSLPFKSNDSNIFKSLIFTAMLLLSADAITVIEKFLFFFSFILFCFVLFFWSINLFFVSFVNYIYTKFYLRKIFTLHKVYCHA